MKSYNTKIDNRSPYTKHSTPSQKFRSPDGKFSSDIHTGIFSPYSSEEEDEIPNELALTLKDTNSAQKFNEIVEKGRQASVQRAGWECGSEYRSRLRSKYMRNTAAFGNTLGDTEGKLNVRVFEDFRG